MDIKNIIIFKSEIFLSIITYILNFFKSIQLNVQLDINIFFFFFTHILGKSMTKWKNILCDAFHHL